MISNSSFTMKPEAVAFVAADSKSDILAQLAGVFAGAYELDAAVVEEALLEREALGSTGFGRAAAIPHARIEGLMRPVAALMKLDHPVDFDAADGMPVDLIVGLLSPVDCGVTHLHALAALSRSIRDEAVHAKLLEAEDRDALFALLTNVADRDAA